MEKPVLSCARTGAVFATLMARSLVQFSLTAEAGVVWERIGKRPSVSVAKAWMLFKKVISAIVKVRATASESDVKMLPSRGAESCGNETRNRVVLAALLLALAADVAGGPPARGTDSTGMNAAPHTPRSDSGPVLQIGRLVETFAGLSTVSGGYQIAKIAENGQAKLRILKNGSEVCTIPRDNMNCDATVSRSGRVTTRAAYSIAVDGLIVQEMISQDAGCARRISSLGYCVERRYITTTRDNKLPWQ